MSGSKLKLGQESSASIDPAPDVGVLVRFNGQQLPAILSLGKKETINFGNFQVEILPVEIISKPKLKPNRKPIPRRFKFTTDAVVRYYSGASEDEAFALFCRRNGDHDRNLVEIEEISVDNHG